MSPDWSSEKKSSPTILYFLLDQGPQTGEAFSQEFERERFDADQRCIAIFRGGLT